jgi:hypothetical protein
MTMQKLMFHVHLTKRILQRHILIYFKTMYLVYHISVVLALYLTPLFAKMTQEFTFVECQHVM